MYLGILITKKFYAGRVYLLYLSELNIVLYHISIAVSLWNQIGYLKPVCNIR